MKNFINNVLAWLNGSMAMSADEMVFVKMSVLN